MGLTVADGMRLGLGLTMDVILIAGLIIVIGAVVNYFFDDTRWF